MALQIVRFFKEISDIPYSVSSRSTAVNQSNVICEHVQNLLEICATSTCRAAASCIIRFDYHLIFLEEGGCS